MKRVLTALVLAPSAVGVIFSGQLLAVQVVVATIATLCAMEFRNLIGHFQFEKPLATGLGIGLCLLLLPLPYAFPVLMVGTLLMLALMLRSREMRQTLPSAGAAMLGIIYIFGSWKSALLLWRIDPHWLLLALAINWVGDSAALGVGRLIGRHKMAPVISPAKSWEGAAGSLVVSAAVAVGYIQWFSPETPLWLALVIAAFANMAGQVGDLAESALKRGAGIKDSGAMLPGHGGWLDRLDSSLFSMPVVYTVLLTARLFRDGF